MIVKDLIEILNQLDPKSIVVLSHDPEGNTFSALEDYTEGYYDTVSEDFWSEEEFFDDDSDDDLDDDSEYYSKPHGLPAIVFWPRS
jgi:hypothetical protein